MADDSSASGRLNQLLNETAFLYGGNSVFVENLYAMWAKDPASVEPSWRAFFTALREQADVVTKAAQRPSRSSPSAAAAAWAWAAATMSGSRP